VSQYGIDPCGGGGEWYFVTNGDWIEGGDMFESTARAIAERLNGQAAEIERLRIDRDEALAKADHWIGQCREINQENIKLGGAVAYLHGHVTQNAGGGQPYTYAWQSVWEEFERRVDE
jgi:hypothetical protein